MRLGIFSVMDFYPEQQGSAAQFYREVMELAVAAEDLGYDSVWIAEHHFAPYGLCPAPSVLLSAIAQRTKRLRIGPAVCVLPFHDPVKVAEEYAVLDVVSGGRLDFGVGRGYLVHEFAGHLIDREESQQRFDEALEVIELAWSGKPFEYAGRFHRYPCIALNTLPLQKPYPPIAIAALSPTSYARIGAHGYSLMGVPYILEEVTVLEGLLTTYRSSTQESNKAANKPGVAIAFHVHVAPTQSEAEARARPYITRYCETRAVGNTKNFAQLMERRLIAVGDSKHVTDILQQLAGFGADRVLCLMNFGGMPLQMVLESLTLTAQEVMPRLAAWSAV